MSGQADMRLRRVAVTVGAEVEVSSIAERSDGMIFVVDVESTLANPAGKAVRDMRNKTKLFGLVVNNVPFPKNNSYYGYGGKDR